MTSLLLNRYFEARWLVNFSFSIPKFLSSLLRHRLSKNFLDLTSAFLQALIHGNYARSPMGDLRTALVGCGGRGMLGLVSSVSQPFGEDRIK